MALLEIKNLTLRFGGLTAVKDVSLQVPRGSIFSIIGPNGAGKTSVFNAITGIYEPTAGEILFQERAIAKPFTRQVVLNSLLIGMFTAVVCGLISLDINLLWRATIRRPFDIDQFYRSAARASDPQARKFTYAEAFANFAGYLRGDLAVEPTARSWRIVSADGTQLLGRAPNEAEGRTQRDQFQAIAHNLPPRFVVETENVQVFSARGETPLATLPNQTLAEAEEFVRRITEIQQTHRQRIGWLIASIVIGFALGATGFYVVWERSRRTPDVISRGGIARTFQNIRLFHNMTVLENVLVGMDRQFSRNVLGMVLRWPAFRRREQQAFQQARELLAFMGLADCAEAIARSLPYGYQRRLEIARALAMQPGLLLLDEPAAGMNPAESEELMGLIRRIRDRGITILLIEHHMKLVMGISDRIAVLEYGERIAEGTPDEVRANPRVIEAYLGKEEVS